MRGIGLIASVALLFAACSQGQSIVKDSVDTVEDARGIAEVAPEEVWLPLDLAEPEAVSPDLFLDLGPDVPTPECAPGEGCFLDPCEENSQCLSGWCVEHLGDGVCTQLCQEECPPGWSCQQVGTGPDVSYICVSRVANLCRPCATGADCKSPGGAEDVCVDYGEEGSFCGGACLSDEECPFGFSCVEAESVAGVASMQCVADAGVCPCSAKSAKLGLTTPCEVTNEFGSCSGLRLCADSGLTECDAAAPSIETCNGVDDDCDGDVDEGEFVGGKYVELCDDGNACTLDTCLGAEGCGHESLDGGECIDGDACTVGDHCEEGVCVGLPVVCDDKNPCTDDSCDGFGGCTSEFNADACDDGDPCTVADQCSEGVCSGTSIPCDCQEDGDCKALEDGDLCNGTLFCDLASWPYKCTVAPETVVACPAPPAGPDAVCLAASCDPESGKCSLVPANEGFACDDGDPCTLGDKCAAGECVGGPPPICKDDNPCTDDSCAPGAGCVHTPNAKPCNDGNVCTTGDTCAQGECLGGPALVCDDGNACNGVESCDVDTGCKAGMPLFCDDGDLCNGVESCDPATGCKAGNPLVCDDGNLCNGVESCDPISGCKAGTPLSCDDGNLCNGTESCDPATGCKAGMPLDCDDGNPCTIDSCNSATGCAHGNSNEECDDGNACTTGDQCSGGKCLPGSAVSCDDDNVCTTDSCTPSQGCVHMLNQAPCSDGDVCTLDDHCHLGECISSAMLSCDDGNVCTKDACDPDVGCQFVPTADPCDDGNACTVNDHCSGGACVFDGLLDCDDDSVCTKDSCDKAQGCLHAPLEGPCSDGSACTYGDVCANGVCQPGQTLECDDGNACTNDLCDHELGCVHQALNGQPCTDGDPCTVEDLCVGSVCTSGAPMDCDDGNVCTDDSCDPDQLCVHAPLSGACDDGDACTEGESCQGGTCQGGGAVDCDDGNPCTTDSCDSQQGCLHEEFFPCCGNGILENGEECDDGNIVGGDGCEEDCTEFTALSATFDNCGKSGTTGPSQGQCDSQYSGQVFLAGKVTVTGGIQYWTVPFTGTYRIETFGAKGGCGGGNGARMRGDFELAKGTELKILVGQQGSCAPAQVGNGGGGGTFVANTDDTPLIVAGGGGGTGHNSYADYDMSGVTSTNGNPGKYATAGAGGTDGQGGEESWTEANPSVPNGGGGGGFYGNGGSAGAAKGGAAFVNGGNGGNSTGGFGGGGGSDVFIYGCGSSPHGGSGGGGYSGGGGGGTNCNGPGGGGGSFNAGSNPSNSAGANGSHGKVTIVRL